MNHEPLIGSLGSSDEPIPGYRLLTLLGRGGFGEVWKASAPGGISKAVKLIVGGDSSRAGTELRALNRIKDVRHPFLLSIERIEQRPGMLVIVTELGDMNLQEHFRACRANNLPGIPQTELLGLLRDVADVFDYLYQEFALQHLDVKPSNLLLFGKRLKVGDFGLVKNIYDRSASLVHGLTPTYAAPEIFDGRPSRTSDQYSLGILYQEMLTGNLPFNGTSAARLAAQHLRETPDLRSLPAEQQPVIARALSKDPLQRFPNCVALIDALIAATRRQAGGDPAARDDAPAARKTPARPKQAEQAPAPAKTSRATEGGAGSNETSHDADVVAGDPGAPLADEVVSPAIVLGIGGAAARLLQRLRLRIADRLGGIGAIPAFKMILIDADRQKLNEVNRDRTAWDDLETIATPLKTSAEYREQGQLHRRWLARRWLFNVPRNLQTEGLRPLGRLALLTHGERVMAALRAAVAQVTADGRELARDGATVAPPRILLVASIAGGAGSGMLLDLAYAARSELLTAGYSDGIVDGLLLYSTPVGAHKDKAVLNAVATLRELAHFCTPGNCYPGEPLLDVPPFHGNNQTFCTTQLVHCGEDLDAACWSREIDNAAELVYDKLVTPMDRCQGRDRVSARAATAAQPLTVELLRVRQLGGYSGSLVHDLTRQLCIDVVDGWCGKPTPLAGGRSSHAATVVLGLLEGDKNFRQHQQLALDAETQILASGVAVRPLVAKAREMLLQEIAQNEQHYLRELFQKAVDGAGSPQQADRQIAGLFMALQDRAIGLDFDERTNDAPRNTLFDRLQTRMASHATQLAGQFTAWVHNLVDLPEVGVDGARLATEAGRSYVRDLFGAVTSEIQAIRIRQTESRILLTASPQNGDAPRGGLFWRQRRGNQRAALEEKLLDHGLLCFEELLLVCVQWQLRSIESQASAVIDQLLCLWQELKQFGNRLAAEELNHASCEYASPTNDEQALRNVLLSQCPQMAKELYQRIEHEVFTGPKKLQRFLEQYESFDQFLGAPLKHHARQVVLRSIQQVLEVLLRDGACGSDDAALNLDAAIAALFDAPQSELGGADERVFVIAPKEASASRLEQHLSSFGRAAQVLQTQTNSIAVCRQTLGIPIAELLHMITHGQQNLLTIAENLRARSDITWDPLENFGAVSTLYGRTDESAASSEIAATVRLS